MKAHTLARPLVMVAATLVFLAVLPVSRAAQAQPAQTLTLKVADSLPTTHYFSFQAVKPWMDRVVQLSKTKVEFQHFPSEQLGKHKDMLNILRTGVADVVGVPIEAGEFPLHTFFGLPGRYDTSSEGTRIYQQLLKEGPLREEFAKFGARPLFVWATPTYEIFSANKAVVKLEDVKGLKIRSVGGAQDSVIQALGAVPVTIPAPEIYTALQRATVDAAMMVYTSAPAYKLEEVAKYATFGARLGGVTQGFTIMEDRLQKLPADVREAMMKASEEIIAAVAKYLDGQVTQNVSSFEKQGMQINRVSKDEVARWARALEPVTEQWIKQMEVKGLPGKQLVDAWKKVAGR